MLSNNTSLPNLMSFPEDRQWIGLSNWAIFCDYLKSVARATGLTAHHLPLLKAPQWELCNGHLAGIIYQNIKDPRSIGVTEKKLSGECDNSSAATQALAKERIQQFCYMPATLFKEYFKQLEALQKAASDVGCEVKDEDLCSRFLTLLSADQL
ncbi:hypothetical protein FB446DRAFT_710213 [Lentinula raphanica]|nr:hypothetical protein FB446DRAFT_710213 [Lentinula raphanica]